MAASRKDLAVFWEVLESVLGYALGLINLKSMVMGMGAFEGHMRKECVAAFTSMSVVLRDKRRLAFVGSPRVEREQLQEL